MLLVKMIALKSRHRHVQRVIYGLTIVWAFMLYSQHSLSQHRISKTSSYKCRRIRKKL